jgi:hypothetical protein
MRLAVIEAEKVKWRSNSNSTRRVLAAKKEEEKIKRRYNLSNWPPTGHHSQNNEYGMRPREIELTIGA